MAEKASYSARPHLRDPSFCSLAQNLRMKPKKNEKKIAGLGFPSDAIKLHFFDCEGSAKLSTEKI